MAQMSPLLKLVTLGAGSLVFLCLSVHLINVQYHARTLFVEHEKAVAHGRHLKDDQAELLMKIRRASLPGRIAEGAQSMGLVIASDENTVSLVMDADEGRGPAEGASGEKK